MIRRKTKSNPTDHDLISKLTVKKSFPDYGTMYEVYLGKRRIGFADIDHGKTEISFVNINEEYRRKGVSSFLYDYIEKDLDRKLKPSEDLLDDGEAFWKARIKKSNPRDEEFLKTIFIKTECKRLYNTIEYYIYRNEDSLKRDRFGKLHRDFAIAHAYYDIKDKWIYDLYVNPNYQRKGLASYLYDYIEQDNNIKLRPSDSLDPDGKKFWENRLKKNPKPKPKLRKIT